MHMHITQSMCNQTTDTLTSIPPERYSDTVHWPGLRHHHHAHNYIQGYEEEKDEYEMVITSKTFQCMCYSKEGKIPQGLSVMDNLYVAVHAKTLSMAQNNISLFSYP